MINDLICFSLWSKFPHNRNILNENYTRLHSVEFIEVEKCNVHERF